MTHGRGMEKASGTATYATVDNSLLVRKVIVNSGIYQYELESVLAAEKVNSGTTVEEVAQLLPGDFFRRFADTFFHDAVVGSKQELWGWRRVGERVCWMRPICNANSSSTPKEPFGLVRLLILSINASRICKSGSSIWKVFMVLLFY